MALSLHIDNQACTGCGLCRDECPVKAVLQSHENIFSIDQELCIGCSHCACVCPVDAVRSGDGEFLPWTDPGLDPEKVRMFLDGKRSVRRYTDEPVNAGTIAAVVRRGLFSATASNTQDCGVVVLRGQEVLQLGSGIIRIFGRAYRLVSNPFVRFLLRFTYARRYVYPRKALESFREFVEGYHRGNDMLFHGAPVCICVTYPKNNRLFGPINCTLAGAAMMYYAESLGLGSCMIGFAQIALNWFPRLRKSAGIEKDRRIGLVFTLGRSGKVYRRLPIRAFHIAGIAGTEVESEE